MRYIIFIFFLFFFAVCYSESNQAVEYLSSIKALRGYFVQYNPDRTKSSGSLWLSVPGKLRIEYDNPPIVLVINKNLLTYHDKKLDETSHAFIEKNDPILTILKNPEIISNSKIIQNKDYILITRSNDDKKFTIKLTKNPMKIASFIVDDSNSGITELKFYDLSHNKNIDKKIFTEF